MKFGKLIQALIDDALPTWKDKYLAYKRLKKRLNALLAESLLAVEERHGSRYAADDAGMHATEGSLGGKRGRQMQDQGRTAKRRHLLNDVEFRCLLEEEFKRLLDGELEKLNDFVVEKEEEFVMKFQLFNEEIERRKDALQANDQTQLDLINLQKDVVVFHGEMVLLKNYSSLNYRGLVKIVKKHDRLTGAWLRLSFIPDVRRQPFYSTEIISRLVRECESNLLSLFPSRSGETFDEPSFERDTQESAFEDDSVFSEDVIRQIHKNTLAALQTIRNMSRGSSTYNALSVPPGEDNEDAESVIDEE
ncbi:hypothetical protein GOP47_0026327 [Adiantum capillus-veneris]|nr:hypothetical protein GOP47_0026327 [Adiantum capillus-veneris]